MSIEKEKKKNAPPQAKFFASVHEFLLSIDIKKI